MCRVCILKLDSTLIKLIFSLVRICVDIMMMICLHMVLNHTEREELNTDRVLRFTRSMRRQGQWRLALHSISEMGH
jgi:hypothetical protein